MESHESDFSSSQRTDCVRLIKSLIYILSKALYRCQQLTPFSELSWCCMRDYFRQVFGLQYPDNSYVLLARITYQALFIGVVLQRQLFVVVGINTTHVTKMALRVCQKHNKENNSFMYHPLIDCIAHKHTKRTNEGTKNEANARMSKQAKTRANRRKHERTSERANERTSERANERTTD